MVCFLVSQKSEDLVCFSGLYLKYVSSLTTVCLIWHNLLAFTVGLFIDFSVMFVLLFVTMTQIVITGSYFSSLVCQSIALCVF